MIKKKYTGSSGEDISSDKDQVGIRTLTPNKLLGIIRSQALPFLIIQLMIVFVSLSTIFLSYTKIVHIIQRVTHNIADYVKTENKKWQH